MLIPGRTRTSDPVVNGHLLCQLSYRDIENPGVARAFLPEARLLEGI
jgi:hypothetical protein